MDLFGRDLLTTQEWSKPELEAVLDLAAKMKRDRFSDEVASGPRSCIYDVAENRLHVQKAIMALTMGGL